MLVDDNPTIRRALHHVFDFSPDWDVCGEASNGREGIEKAKALHPDLIVMDVSMPVMNGLEAARVIHDTMPRTLVILCSLHTECAAFRGTPSRGSRHRFQDPKHADACQQSARIASEHELSLWLSPVRKP